MAELSRGDPVKLALVMAGGAALGLAFGLGMRSFTGPHLKGSGALYWCVWGICGAFAALILYRMCVESSLAGRVKLALVTVDAMAMGLGFALLMKLVFVLYAGRSVGTALVLFGIWAGVLGFQLLSYAHKEFRDVRFVPLGFASFGVLLLLHNHWSNLVATWLGQ